MYFVIGPDGSQYGPASVYQLKGWIAENRVTPDTMLRDQATGESVRAGNLIELFSPTSGVGPPASSHNPYASPSQNQYQANPYANSHQRESDDTFPWGSIVRSALAVLMFFVFQGLGVIFGGFALYTAFQCNSQGNKYGPLAIAVAVIALVIVGVGWFLRVQGAPV